MDTWNVGSGDCGAEDCGTGDFGTGDCGTGVFGTDPGIEGGSADTGLRNCDGYDNRDHCQMGN